MTRVMKARRASVLACKHPVQIGQLIVCRDGIWVCMACCLAEIKQRQADDHAAR